MKIFRNYSNSSKGFNSIQSGFTLIELLIVIAVIGVLAAVVLAAINPLEQLARGRDSSRTSAVDELGRAILAYYTAQNATFPGGAASWTTSLVSSGDIKVIPANPAYTQAGVGVCSTNLGTGTGPGYCYLVTPNTDAAVYAAAESNSTLVRSTCGAGALATTWIMWSYTQSRSGLYCSPAAQPVLPITAANFH